jgi:hypothetical protein
VLPLDDDILGVFANPNESEDYSKALERLHKTVMSSALGQASVEGMDANVQVIHWQC